MLCYVISTVEPVDQRLQIKMCMSSSRTWARKSESPKESDSRQIALAAQLAQEYVRYFWVTASEPSSRRFNLDRPGERLRLSAHHRCRGSYLEQQLSSKLSVTLVL